MPRDMLDGVGDMLRDMLNGVWDMLRDTLNEVGDMLRDLLNPPHHGVDPFGLGDLGEGATQLFDINHVNPDGLLGYFGRSPGSGRANIGAGVTKGLGAVGEQVVAVAAARARADDAVARLRAGEALDAVRAARGAPPAPGAASAPPKMPTPAAPGFPMAHAARASPTPGPVLLRGPRQRRKRRDAPCPE